MDGAQQPGVPPDAARAPAPQPVAEEQTFHDISERLVGNVAKRRYGIAVTDFDGNGDYELVVTGYGGSNEIWDVQGDRLVDVAPPELKDEERRAIGVAACDLDGDGLEEIYFLNVDRFGGLGNVSDRLYRRAGTRWVDVFEQPENAASVNRFSGRSVLCFDRDGDGDYGVFVANYGGPMKLFEVDAEWGLSDVAPSLGMDLTTGGRSLVNLPDADGRMRIFAGNENGPNFFFVGTNPEYREAAGTFGISDRRGLFVASLYSMRMTMDGSILSTGIGRTPSTLYESRRPLRRCCTSGDGHPVANPHGDRG